MSDGLEYEQYLTTAFLMKLFMMGLVVYVAMRIPHTLRSFKRWTQQKRAAWRRSVAKRKLEREKRKMGTARERYVHQYVADAITHVLEEAWLSNRLKREEVNLYYKKLAHAMKLKDLLPRNWQEALKEIIRSRLTNEYKKDPDKLLEKHREKHPPENNVVRPKFGQKMLAQLEARKKTTA